MAQTNVSNHAILPFGPVTPYGMTIFQIIIHKQVIPLAYEIPSYI